MNRPNQPLNLILREAVPEDLPEMQKLFVDTIRAVCVNDYTASQIEVWTSSVKNHDRWRSRLESQKVIIAELDKRIVGYISLENSDYLDLLYIHKDYQGRGIATKLYHSIEQEAKLQGSEILNSHVSITAKPFFEKAGFKIVKENWMTISGVEIMNYKMIKYF